jgi:hypothetical protein
MWESLLSSHHPLNLPNGWGDRLYCLDLGHFPASSRHSFTAMEPFTPDESLMDTALAFERTVLKTEQTAIACEVSAIELRVSQRETRLAVIRCYQTRNQLAQALQKFQDSEISP